MRQRPPSRLLSVRRNGAHVMRYVRQLSRLMCVTGAMLLSLLAARPAAAQKVWLDPHEGPQGARDFMELFRPDAPWQQAASHVEAFEVGGGMAYQGPEADLRQIIADLRRRNIALAVGMGPLSGMVDGVQRCGYHVEGYGAPGGPLAVAQRMARFGGVVQYFVMDEVVYYGHVYNGPNACHSSPSDIAKEIADKIRQVRTVFPQAQYGDVEPSPIPSLPQATWLADLATFFDAFQANTGTKLAFFRLDLDWRGAWQPLIPPLAQILKQRGIPLQIIYDSSPLDANGSDARAVAGTIANFKLYESGGRSPPDAASIQWWTKYPSHVLPETDPTSGTYLINEYVRWRQSHH